MEEEKELLKAKAESGYIVCNAEECPLHEQCLRWHVFQQMPVSKWYYTCVNPKSEGAATQHCVHYRPAQKVMMARGMTQIFTDDMPKRVESGVRNTLIARYNRSYYFEYRKGKRLIPPSMQEEICQLFREFGWSGDVTFDDYVEDYEW